MTYPRYQTAVQHYFKALWNYNARTDNEHTYRTDLQNFLREACSEFQDNIEPRHEVKDGQHQLGVPDFSFIDNKKLGTVGLLENKSIGADINALVHSQQVKKYRKRSENIILTNYHNWLLVKEGTVTHQASLGTLDDIKHKAQPDARGVADLQVLLTAFLSQEPRGISRKKELAEQLALRCHDLRDFLVQEMERQKRAGEQSPLWDIFGAFQEYVDSELTPDVFADAFAQNLGYSLFLAKLNVHPENTIIDLDNVQRFIPQNFGLIKALANFLKALDDEQYNPIRYRVEEILGMMNYLDLSEITSDLSFNTRLNLPDDEARLFERDPYIYFYEHFLQAYDARMKESRGVYYTPPPVVNFIIRGVNHILKHDFGIAEGLADEQQVQLLDFATGTGTFILEALMQMFEEPDIAGSKAMQNLLVKDHVLKNFYGFEYLIAPYTIAHLKLSQFLKDKGFRIEKPLKIYLTNTLDMKPHNKQYHIPFMQTLKAESEAAHKVKEMPIRVIVGNPPYNVKSKNSGPIDELVKEAYAPKDEKKMNWDDYVKFIRFAHHKMETIERGVIGIITNNSYLNAVTLRQMRNRLMQDFSAIYILNLHGNSLIGEQAPDGRQDANVFDIRVGTCIAFFVKTEAKPKHCKIYYAAIKSSKRLDKYKQLAEGDMHLFEPLDVAAFNKQFATTRWAKRFTEPLSFFVPSGDDFAERLEAYGDFWGVTDIYIEYGGGIQTDRDKLLINHNAEKLAEHVRKAFDGHYDAEFKNKYNIENSSSYPLLERLKNNKFDNACIQPILYRPFDTRKIYYSVGFTSRPAWEIMRYLAEESEQYGLVFCRQLVMTEWKHILVTDKICERCYVSINSKELGYIAPLYLYPSSDKGQVNMFAPKEKQENFRPAFRQWLDNKYGQKFTAEQVLGYMYAVLHSPTFRKRYQEFLKIDFPRIPFVDDSQQFEALSSLGWELVQAHTMKIIPDGVVVTFQGEGDNKVTKVAYNSESKTLYINTTQYFNNVPTEAWEFVIGGYQVLDKFLKERKKADRPLVLAELQHIPRVVRILCFTHAQMQKIDELFTCP
ncbi:MAG: type ISP restriction/modification enzyme [Chlorobiaceae bacterium]